MIVKTGVAISWIIACICYMDSCNADDRPRIAVFSGSTATIQNSPPLVTSNKAREKYKLPALKNDEGSNLRNDHLVPQRLAAPVEVLIEMYTAHPLEKDAADLYSSPDGYVDSSGVFHETQQSVDDKPVYKVTLTPEDGLYLLPYMARQANGNAWEDDCTESSAPAHQCRQPFFPDASRIFEEIDRGILGVSDEGVANMLASRATYDFFRPVPSAGYRKGLTESERTDIGLGDIPPEVAGEDFFAYRPFHLSQSVRYHDLAKLTNAMQGALNSGQYLGAIWFEGSPRVEETLYWLNLLIDTPLPIVSNAAQRTNRTLSADGPRNIVDSVDYILSKSWVNADGKDELGAVLIQDEQIIAARQAQKSDARPGGYIATGDHGGILGTIGKPGAVTIYFKPVSLHTWKSEVNMSRLPTAVNGVQKQKGKLKSTQVIIKNEDGFLIGETIPRVTLVKQVHYSQGSSAAVDEVDIMARIEKNLRGNPLAGFVAEGTAPYGSMTSAQTKALVIAAFSGMPTVRVGRGNAGGLTPVNPNDVFIEGNNLTATKARLLLKACLMKFGSLPVAKDPGNPRTEEKKNLQAAIAKFQTVFNNH